MYLCNFLIDKMAISTYLEFNDPIWNLDKTKPQSFFSRSSFVFRNFFTPEGAPMHFVQSSERQLPPSSSFEGHKYISHSIAS